MVYLFNLLCVLISFNDAGNEPKNVSKQFCYDELVSTMQSVALNQTGEALPSKFFLMDLR